jgi:hypothetical protein
VAALRRDRASANAGGVGSALSPLTIELESPADTAIVSPDKNYAVLGKMVAGGIALRDFGKNLVVRRNDIATLRHQIDPVLFRLAIDVMIAALPGARGAHGDEAAVGQRVDVVVDLLRRDVLGDLAGPDEIDRHDIGRDKKIMLRNGRDRLLDVLTQPVDAVRLDAKPLEEQHGVAFAAADIEHRADAEALDEKSPKHRCECMNVAMAYVAAKVRSFFAGH